MSSGRTHLAANVALTGLTCAALDLLSPIRPGQDVLNALAAGMLVGTFLVTPDLDLYGTRTVVLRAWGPLWVVWWPVLRLSRHRGRSHTYLQGPLFRAAYLLTVLFLALLALTPLLGPGHARPVGTWLLAYAPWWGGGYLLTQWCHLWLDRIPLHWKQL